MKLKRFILIKNSNFSVVWLPNLKNFNMLHSQHQITIDYYIRYIDHILYIMKLLYHKYNILMSQNTVYLEI